MVLRGAPYSQDPASILPKVLSITMRGKGELPDVFGEALGPYFVSQRFRDLLDSLEPGCHDYVAISVVSESPAKGRVDHGPYYVLLPPPVIDCVEIEGTEFWEGGNGYAAYNAGSRKLSPSHDDPCNFKRAALSGRHLWRLPREFTPKYACSSDFWRKFTAGHLTGFVTKKICSLV